MFQPPEVVCLTGACYFHRTLAERLLKPWADHSPHDHIHKNMYPMAMRHEPISMKLRLAIPSPGQSRDLCASQSIHHTQSRFQEASEGCSSPLADKTYFCGSLTNHCLQGAEKKVRFPLVYRFCLGSTFRYRHAANRVFDHKLRP